MRVVVIVVLGLFIDEITLCLNHVLIIISQQQGRIQEDERKEAEERLGKKRKISGGNEWMLKKIC